MDSINNEVIQLNNEVKKLIYHSLLLDYIDRPVINDDMIAVMVKILRDAKVDKTYMSYYIVSVMLMQIALDTHEEVSNTEESESPAKLRKRQLSILAGDYYSSMYYHILAKTKDIEFINLISRGVQEVNEAKVRLYMDKGADIDTLIMYLKQIETTLVEKTAEHFNVTEQKDLFIDFLLWKRLMAELDRYQNNRNSKFIHALQSIHSVYDEKVDIISDLLKREITKVSDRLRVSILQNNKRDDMVLRIETSIS